MFWWGYNEQNHGCYLKGWDSLCKPKACGGIGIRRSADFKKSLISKLTWDVATNANKQWVIMYREKYLWGQDFIYMQPPKQASPICQGIFKCRKNLPHHIQHIKKIIIMVLNHIEKKLVSFFFFFFPQQPNQRLSSVARAHMTSRPIYICHL
jgi:hypothetical protein